MNAFRRKTFIISLRRVRVRRLQVVRQLAGYHSPFEIIDAVDAKQVRPEFIPRAKGAEGLNDGALACYHSHIGIFERIVDYGLDYAMVLEDDFVFGDSKIITAETIWNHIPPDADHIQLHNFRTNFSSGYRVDEKGDLFNKLGCTNVITVGYIISSRLANYILNHHPIPKMPIDCLLIEISKQGIFDFYDVNESVITMYWGLPSEINEKPE